VLLKAMPYCRIDNPGEVWRIPCETHVLRCGTNGTRKNLNYVKVLAKGLRLIEAMAEARSSCQLSDLARTLGQPKASVIRILFTLKQEGYVQ
jgi:DNA-binding IclR family transcriptional regulator